MPVSPPTERVGIPGIDRHQGNGFVLHGVEEPGVRRIKLSAGRERTISDRGGRGALSTTASTSTSVRGSQHSHITSFSCST